MATGRILEQMCEDVDHLFAAVHRRHGGHKVDSFLLGDHVENTRNQCIPSAEPVRRRTFRQAGRGIHSRMGEGSDALLAHELDRGGHGALTRICHASTLPLFTTFVVHGYYERSNITNMGYLVVAVWLVQALVGATLLVGFFRSTRRSAPPAIIAHALLMIGFLGPWLAYLATGQAWWPWIALDVLMIGIPFGETMMVRRTRKLRGESNPGMRDYGHAVAAIVAGRFPLRVAFHALFSAAVFFGALAVAISATVVAA